jgi:hypothetical protein
MQRYSSNRSCKALLWDDLPTGNRRWRSKTKQLPRQCSLLAALTSHALCNHSGDRCVGSSCQALRKHSVTQAWKLKANS